MLRRIQISILMLFMALTGSSQLDTEHYLAPLTSAVHPFIGNAGHQIIYLSTPSIDPVNYTIYDGENNIINSGTVKNGAPIAYGAAGEMNGPNTDLMIGKNQLNQVLTGRGIRVVADAPIYCNVRIRSSNNAQAASITAKGKAALGNTFRIGHMPTPQKGSNWGLNSLGSKLATFGIYATEDNTTVTIDLTKVKPVLHGPGAANTNSAFTVTLNKGETYVVALKNADAPNRNAGAGFNGGLVTSDKPIAVSSGSMGGYMANNYQADYGADQIVPYEKVGTEYAVVRGASGNNGLEKVMITAHKNGTEVKINGLVVKTLNAGEYYLANGSKYSNGSMFIETSKPAYAYQFMMGSNKNDNKTPGMNFLPPITCETSNYVDEIPFINKAGNLNLQGGSVNIVTTKVGSNLEFFRNGVIRNDLLGTPKNIPNSDYRYYKVSNLSGHIAVYSETVALVSFSGYNGAAGFGGFYSGWKEGVVEDSVTCLPGHIFETSGRYDSYKWFLDGVEIPGETSDSLFATETGYYTYEYEKAGCKDTSDSIYAVALNKFELEGDTAFCSGESVDWEITGSGFDSISWNNGALVDVQNITIDSDGTTPVRIYSDVTQECYVDTSVLTIEVTKPEIELRDTTVCTGESVTLDAVDTGLNYLWSTAETTQTIDVNQSGAYEVIAANDSGCADTASMTLTIQSCNTDAEVTKSDFTDKYFSGATTIYTIVARNHGPADVTNGDISDPLPVGISAGDVTWIATPFGGATSTVSTAMNGALTDVINIPAGDSIVYTVNIFVPPAFVGDLENTVTITVDNDTFPDNDIATDIDSKDCNFEAAGTINSRQAGWVKMGNVVTGVPYKISPTGGSRTFTPSNGPEAGNTITALIYNTGSGNSVSLTRNRYKPNNSRIDQLTVYDNTPHSWTGLSGSGNEKPPILGFMAFIDQNRNGQFDSGLETFYRDITSLTMTPNTSGELYMAFYDDGVYTDNAGTIGISVKSELESTDIGADTAICVGESVMLDAQNPDAASWEWNTGEFTQKINVTTSGEYTVEITSVGGCEIHDTINLIVHPCNIDLGVTKTDGRDDYTPGTTTEYTIVVNNYGPYDAVDVTVNDPAPVGISAGDISWDANVYGGASSGVVGSQSGILNDLVNIPVGDSIVYSVNIAVPGDYKDDLINVVNITHPLDTNPANDTAEDIDYNGLCSGATISSFAEQFNTGVKINPGENDPNWEIQWINDPSYYVYSPNSYATPTSNAVIPAVGMNKAAGVWGNASYPDYLWVCYPWTGANNGPGKHVDVDGDGKIQEYSGGQSIVGTGDAVILKFSKTFEMTAAQLEASDISFDIAADNQIMDIIVNGVSQGPKTLNSYTLHPHSITQGFQLGTNTIEIVVNSGPGFAGLMIANSTIKAVDSVSLKITDPPVGCAPVLVDLSDSLWTAGSINVTDLLYFEDAAATTPLINYATADSGSYFIVGVNQVGCADTSQVNVSQNPRPDVVLREDTAVCQGEDVTLDAGTFTTWKWNVGNESGQTITIDSTYEYKVTVSNVYGCLDSDSVVVTINDLPIVTVRDTIICPGGTGTFTAVSSTITQYLWSKLGNGDKLVTKGTLEGLYEVEITDVNGCKDTAEAQLSYHVPPVVTVNNDTICIGDPAGQFTATSSTATSYFWKDNGGGVLGTTSGSIAGDYTVIVEDINTCKDTATGVLKVDTLPIVELVGAAICDDVPDVDLIAVSTTAVEFLWGGLGTGTTQMIKASTQGNYEVTVTDVNGCKSSDNADVQRYPMPTVTVANESVCPGDVATFTAVSPTATIYEWKQNGTGSIRTSEGPVEGTYEVVVTDVNGCKDTAEAEMTFFIPPIVTVNSDTICVGDPAATFRASSLTAKSFLWKENGSGNTPVTSGTTAGNYTVFVTDANGCRDTATGTLKVDTLPHVFVNDSVICSDVSSIDLIATSTTAIDYVWSGAGIGSSSIISITDAGSYVVTVTDENGCKQEDDANVDIVQKPDTFSIDGVLQACEGDEIDLSITAIAQNNQWNTGDNGTGITVTETGSYDVILSNTAHGLTCSEAALKEVEFLPYPEDPIIDEFKTCFAYTKELELSIETPATVEWADATGRGNDSTLLVTGVGFYNAQLYYYPMCPIDASVEVEEFCPMTFFVPNAFTPNDDGRNDTFEPKMSNIEEYKLYIFNRWGQLIFTSTSPDNQWDGTYLGNECQIDVYVYKIVVTGYYEEGDLDEEMLTGTVTLLR